MTFHPSLANLISARVRQGLSIAGIVIIVSLVALLIVANHQLASLQKQLTPLVTRELRKTLGRDVRVGSVTLTGWDAVEITDAAVAKGPTFADGTALTVPRATARVNLVALAAGGGKNVMGAIQQVKLERPVAHVARDAQGDWDFQDIVDRIQQRHAGGSLNTQLLVDGGQVAYRDAQGFGAGQPIDRRVEDVTARVTPFGNETYQFEVTGQDAAQQMGRMRVAGSYARRAGAANVNVSANRVVMKELSRYLPASLPITFENGTAAFRLSALFRNLPTPSTTRKLPTTQLVAEVDLRGVGLRLDEMSAPMMATSGRLRLIHDQHRYPSGSRLELIDVHAEAGALPMTISGDVSDLNLFDLANANPMYQVRMAAATKDGTAITQLFSGMPWMQALKLDGPVSVEATASGRHNRLRIDGTVQSAHFTDREVTGEHTALQFTLRPFADLERGEATLEGTATIARAQLGDSSVERVSLSGASSTPWAQLSTDITVRGHVQARAVTFPWGDARDISSRFTLTGDQFALQGMRATLYGGKIAGDVTVPILKHGEPDAPIRATAQYTGVDLAQFATVLKLADLTGRADGSIRLTAGTDGAMQLATELTSTDASYRQYHASKLAASLHLQTQDGATALAIPSATARTAYGTFTIANGTYQREGGQMTLALPLHGERIPLAQFAKDFDGEATLDGTLTGSVSAPELAATVRATRGALLGIDFATAQGEMRLRGQELRFRNVTLARPDMAVAIPGGAEGFDPRNGLRDVTATLDIHGAPLQDVLALVKQQSPWPVDGGVQGTVQIRHTGDGVTATGDAHIPQAVVHLPRGTGAYPLALDDMRLQFDIDGRTMRVEQLTLQQGDSTVRATGAVTSQPGDALASDLTFAGDRALLEDLPQEYFGIPVALSGPAEVQGRLSGVLDGTGPDPLTLDLNLRSTQLAVEDVPVGTGAVALRFTYRPQSRVLRITDAQIDNQAFSLTSSGVYQLNRGTMEDVRATLSRMDLAALRALLAQGEPGGKAGMLREMLAQSVLGELRGEGAVEVTAHGAWKRPELTLGLHFTQLALGDTPLPNLRATLAAEQADGRMALRIREAVAEGGAAGGRVQLRGLVVPNARVDLRLTAADITPRTLSPWLGDRLPVDGSLTFDGTLAGPWKTPVADADVRIDAPVIAGHTLQSVRAHLHAAQDRVTVRDGVIAVRAGSPALTFQGAAPMVVRGLQVAFPTDRPIAFSADLPRQDLSLVRAFLPTLPAIDGTVEGQVRVGGTLAAPAITRGLFTVAGSADLPATPRAYANRVENLNLRLAVTGDARRSTLTIDSFSATLDRLEDGKRPKGFQPGSVAMSGSVRLATRDFATPDHWQWDVYAKILRLPLAQDLFLVPQATGFLHLQTQEGGPVLTGVMLADHVKIKQPELATPTRAWGPFAFNPRLSVILQVGEGVKIAKSIVRLPLKVTPLPWPEATELATPEIDAAHPSFDYHAGMLNPNTNGELPGSWGVVTGSLENPQLYARFEVNKKKLSFPFSLFGSIRNARGHITFSLADGPKITMGIPDFTLPKANAVVGSE